MPKTVYKMLRYLSGDSGQEYLLRKWEPVLEYSSSNCQKIPEQDKILVANLYERAEQYCKLNGMTMTEFMQELETHGLNMNIDYKSMTLGF